MHHIVEAHLNLFAQWYIPQVGSKNLWEDNTWVRTATPVDPSTPSHSMGNINKFSTSSNQTTFKIVSNLPLLYAAWIVSNYWLGHHMISNNQSQS